MKTQYLTIAGVCILSALAISSPSQDGLVPTGKLITGTWAMKVPISERTFRGLVFHIHSDGTYVSRYYDGKGIERGKWKLGNGVITLRVKNTLKKADFRVELPGREKMNLTKISGAREMPNGTLFKGYLFSKNSYANTDQAFKWLADRNAPPNIIDEKYVSEYNPRGRPPNEKGWVYDNRVGYRPIKGDDPEAFYDWAVDHAIGIASGYLGAKHLIPANGLPGAFMHAGIPRATKIDIDELLEVCYPDSSKDSRVFLRNVLMSFLNGETNLDSLPESTLKHEFLKFMYRKGETQGDKAYQFLFLMDVLKKLTRERQE